MLELQGHINSEETEELQNNDTLSIQQTLKQSSMKILNQIDIKKLDEAGKLDELNKLLIKLIK